MKAIIKVICNALERDNTSIRAEMAEHLKRDFADYEQENQRLRKALLEAANHFDELDHHSKAEYARSIAQNKE